MREIHSFVFPAALRGGGITQLTLNSPPAESESQLKTSML